MLKPKPYYRLTSVILPCSIGGGRSAQDVQQAAFPLSDRGLRAGQSAIPLLIYYGPACTAQQRPVP